MNLIEGKVVAESIRTIIKQEVDLFVKTTSKEIGLAVILVGDNPASQVYVRNKIKACEQLGIKSFFYNLPSYSSQEDVAKVLKQLNEDNNVNGIMLQLPLPKQLNEDELLELIDPAKDVDGCHYVSKGRLWTGRDSLIACTPYGVMKMLEFYNIKLDGLNAVVIGRSNLVGKPLAQLLLDKNCTVTICHSKTKNLKDITLRADIICVAIGKSKFLTADMVNEGAVVIDVGINRDENNKLTGDVDFENVAPKCSYITPVPGGVGPMTVTMLMYNTLCAYKKQNNIK